MKFKAYASGSSGNLYSVTDGVSKIMIEAGLPYRKIQKLIGHTLSTFDHCIVSHKHKDHCKGAGDLANIMGKLWLTYGEDFHDGCSLIRGIEVRAVPVPHDVPNYGFIFRSVRDKESLVFITDAFYSPVVFGFSPTIFAIEANYSKDLLGDCSYQDRVFQSHMSIDQTIKTLKANDLSKTREIHLLHLSESHSDEEMFIKEVQKVTGVMTYAAPKMIKI